MGVPCRKLYVYEDARLHGKTASDPLRLVEWAGVEYDWWMIHPQTGALHIGVYVEDATLSQNSVRREAICVIQPGFFAKVLEEEFVAELAEPAPEDSPVESVFQKTADWHGEQASLSLALPADLDTRFSWEPTIETRNPDETQLIPSLPGPALPAAAPGVVATNRDSFLDSGKILIPATRPKPEGESEPTPEPALPGGVLRAPVLLMGTPPNQSHELLDSRPSSL